MLKLAESAEGPFYDTPWADVLVALGARAFRFAADPNKLPASDQLFIAITVPVRDLAASLIAAGWMLTAPVPSRADVATQLHSLRRGTLVRVVTDRLVVLDSFFEEKADGTVHIGGSRFPSSRIIGIGPVTGYDPGPCKMSVPAPPAFGPYNPERWLDFMFGPPAGLAIIGAKTPILTDLETKVSTKSSSSTPTRLRDLVLPAEGRVPTWATRMMSPSSLSDDMDDVPEFRAVVLDGASAIAAVDLVDAPVAVAVIDRSKMDDLAAEFVAQRRNAPGATLLNPLVDLGWRSSDGIEILAFRTRR
jgi:hypothetical protein